VGKARILQSFYQGVGGSSWANSVTQYCQGVPSGTVFLQTAQVPQPVIRRAFSRESLPTTGASHRHIPVSSQLAAEAVSAAQHFGNTTGASKCERTVT